MDEGGLLEALVRAYSPTGHEGTAVRAFTRLAAPLGFTTEVDGAGNGIARIGSGRPQTLFLGHIDTVEGELPVRVEDGRVYGRGSVDAKGALAAALLAAKDHAGPGEIVVVAAVGEEVDSRGARHLIPRHSPDFLIVGEPSGWSRVTIGYKGNLDLVLTFEGERTHLSSPTPTAADTAIDFVSGLRRFLDVSRGDTPFSSITAKVHTMRTTRTGGREAAEVGVNFRLPPGIRTEHVLTYLDDHGIAGRCRITDRSEAILVDAGNAVVRALVAGIREVGGRPTFRKKAGTSDMNVAAPIWGCPAATYGPGDSHLDHTDAEALELEDLRKAVRVLGRGFSDLARRGARAEG